MAKKVTTEEMIAKAKAAGVKVTITQRPKGQGEVTPLPGLRPSAMHDRAESPLGYGRRRSLHLARRDRLAGLVAPGLLLGAAMVSWATFGLLTEP